MTRLTPVAGPNGLDQAQQALWDHIVSGRRAQPVGRPPESLGGPFHPWMYPFNPWMYAAWGGLHAVRLGEYLRDESSLDPRIRELAILTVATRFRAEFEFWAHSTAAREADLPEEVIEAIRSGQEALGGGPEGSDAVYSAVRQLLDSGRIDDATTTEIHGLLGDGGLVELVMLTGYYCLVSMTLNTFEVSPPGQTVSYWPNPDL